MEAEAGGAAMVPSIKVMKLRYPGTCECGVLVAAGARAGWDRSTKSVVCEACLAPVVDAPAFDSSSEYLTVQETNAPVPPTRPADVEAAGASLRREADRRQAKREERIRTRHPRVGGMILALTDDPPSTKAFQSGAEGERQAAQRISERCGPEVLFLFNRSLGAGRRDGDIDMIAIHPGGIHVIDVKRYKDATVEVRRTGGLFSPTVKKLYVGGRDRTTMVNGLAKQVDAVKRALADFPGADGIPVEAALCFVDAQLPMFRTLDIAGIPVLGPKGTAKMLSAASVHVTSGDDAAIHAHLSSRLPAAS